MKKITLILFGLIIIFLIILSVRISFLKDKGKTKNFNESSTIEEISVIGEINCLPKIGKGPQTLECSIGLKDEKGIYYGLKNLSEVDPENKFSIGGEKVKIKGFFKRGEILKGPDGNLYDIVGVINVISIEKIDEN